MSTISPGRHNPPNGSEKTTTTDSLLKEIVTGTAAEAVMAVRYSTSPPGPTFIPSLDELILEGRPHRGGSSLQRGDLIELVGPSGSGKTSMITFFLLTTLLPSALPSNHNIPLGGRGLSAILIQPKSHRPLLPSLIENMRSHISICVPHLTNDDQDSSEVDDIIGESLKRLKIYKIKRWKDLALVLRAIPSLPREGGSIDLVLIDGMSDDYYSNRYKDERRPRTATAATTASSASTATAPGGVGGKIVGTEDIGMREIMDGIGRLRKEFGTVVICSIQALRVSSSSPFPISHLPHPYPTPYAAPRPSSDPSLNNMVSTSGYSSSATFWPLSIQIALRGKTRGLQYPGETTLVDALRQKRTNQTNGHGQGQGVRYEGIVRMPNTSSNGAAVGTFAGARFRFAIGHDGVQVWVD